MSKRPPSLAGLGDALVQVVTCVGRGSLPSPCTELTPWGTLSLLQVRLCLTRCARHASAPVPVLAANAPVLQD